jgi:hypothetical protein
MMADTHIGPHALDKAAPSLAIDAAVSAFVLRSSGDVLPPESIASAQSRKIARNLIAAHRRPA